MERTSLKKCGFFSFFKKCEFEMCFYDGNKMHSLKLNVGKAYIGYVCKTTQENFKIIFKIDGKLEDSYTFKPIRGRFILKIKNDFFYGNVYVFSTQNSMFHELECKKIRKNPFSKIPFVKTIEICSPVIERFLLYDGRFYFVNKKTLKSFWSEKNEFVAVALPANWEENFTKNGIPYYINHDYRITTWVRPYSFYFVGKIEGKLKRYKILSKKKREYFNLRRSRLNIIARRGFLIQSTAGQIIGAQVADLMKDIHIYFIDEPGEDYGALLREYFYETSFEIAQDYRMQEVENIFDVLPLNTSNSVDNSYIPPTNIEAVKKTYFNYESAEPENPFFENIENKGKNCLDDKSFFKFVGIFLALAIEHQKNIGVNFSLAFYENILQRNFTISHIQDIQFQSSMVWLLENDYDLSSEDVDVNKNSESISPGNNRQIQNNRKDYVTSLISKCFYKSKISSYESIRNGFYYVCVPEFSEIFNCYDLLYILHGNETVTPALIKQNLVFTNCTNSTKEIIYLLKILDKKNEKYLRKFLSFVTGTGTVLFNAIKFGKFTIYIEQENKKISLIRASSCINKLYIGKYDSLEQFEGIIDFCLYNTEGFHKI
ncbi:HECT domain-containing protein [Hamiltosporidium tvaerminnensis]|uniref:HECT-type E3 ubiquitin transferase n=1 Tax=Hamiltosporidium tvaerminnensis TaxID=1176355 RepID=A0A4Q9LX33_9MICR|nr:HECT domain-containing protein [Hamiltosporidium tvaerminnensis]